MGVRPEEAQAVTVVRLPLGAWMSLMPSLSDLAFLTPILVLFWCTTGVGWLLTDSDTGWHIRAGEWILQNRRVPATDLFSFTKAGQPWFAWEWLSDVLMAVIHRHFGLAGIVLVSLLGLGSTSVCVYRSTREESGHRAIAIVLTGLAMAASTIHWLARAHLVTPLFATVFCWALNRTERKRGPAVLLALPLLTILWVNLHGGFFVGIVLLITYAIGAVGEELVHRASHNAWVRARKYVWAAAAHLGAGRLVHVLLLLSWSHLGLFSARNIPIFAVVTAPGIGLAMREWLEYAGSHWPLRWPGKLSVSLAEVEAGLRVIATSPKRWRPHFVPCFGVLVLASLLAHPGRMKILQAEFDHDRFPVDAVTFLSGKESGLPIRLYSSWQWGGYLIYRLWPSLAVFDDGRTDFYGPAFVEEGLRVWDACPDWSNIFERYRVNSALLPVDSALATVLRERRDWKPVYQDRIAVLFERTEKAR